MAFIASTRDNFLDATSYMSLKEVPDYLGPPFIGVWDRFEDKVKQIKLMDISNKIDTIMFFEDEKTNKDQILEFPRYGEKNIPIDIKYAVVDYLKYELLTLGKDRSVIAENVDGISMKYKYTQKDSLEKNIKTRLRKYELTELPVVWE